MARLLFDIEGNGLLDTITKLHCLWFIDIDTGARQDFADQPGYRPIAEGLRLLMEADLVIGHNIIKYDIPAIQKLYPWFVLDETKVVDTVVISRLIWTNLVETDMNKIRAGTTTLTPKLAGWHSLEAWGHRLGKWKGDYAADMEAQGIAMLGLKPDTPEMTEFVWGTWSEDMHSYCGQDVEVNLAFYDLILTKKYSERAIKLEHEVAFIIARMERNGFAFNVQKAEELVFKLSKLRADLGEGLRDLFPAWYAPDGPLKVAKRDNRRMGYVEGVEYQKVKLVVFNPNSRDHIADRLMKVRGWKPKDMTGSGKPKVDEDVLDSLKYPEAQQLARYMMIQKRIGQIAEGDKAWLKFVRNGRVHCNITTNGAVTGRATHSNFNIAQVPAVDKEFGPECREAFCAAQGYKLLGCDVSGLELRMLGHFMAKHDGGAYAREVIEGDVHSVNASALNGIDFAEFKAMMEDERPLTLITDQYEEARKFLLKKAPEDRPKSIIKEWVKALRSTAKTWIYAFLYGSGDANLGNIMGVGRKQGKFLKDGFLRKIPALKKLIDGVKAAAARGYLTGLDGRLLHIRSDHAALNTLLQSAGALICKRWIVEFVALLREHGLYDRIKLVTWVHDELQMEIPDDLVRPDGTSIVGELCVKAIVNAGNFFGIRVPLTGEYKIGLNWKECH